MAIVSQATTFEGCGLRDLTPGGPNFTRNFLLKRNFFVVWVRDSPQRYQLMITCTSHANVL